MGPKLHHAHVVAVKKIVKAQSNTGVFKKRKNRNVIAPPQQFSRDDFWQWMIICMCTSVHKSSPDSPVGKLARESPFPLSLSVCQKKKDLESFAKKELYRRNLGFYLKIARQIRLNMRWLSNGGWKKVEEQWNNISMLPRKTSSAKQICERIKVERVAAGEIMGRSGGLVGIGPKQARNIWQCIGVTQYEIPLDSRICKWLCELKPSFEIDSKKLSGVPYYEKKMSKIQCLCGKAEILPCLFDAAIFASVDAGKGANEKCR